MTQASVTPTRETPSLMGPWLLSPSPAPLSLQVPHTVRLIARKVTLSFFVTFLGFWFSDNYRRGLSCLHQTSTLQLPVQPVSVSALQSGGHLPVRSSGQPVFDRPGQVHHRTSTPKLFSCVCADCV